MSSKVDVTIGLPVFNGEKYLKRALNSLLHQTYSNFTLIISDNASTDATPQICETFKKKDKRVQYFRYDKNQGMSWNFNNVFDLANTTYFMWAAADDIWEPDFINSCMKLLLSNDMALVAGSMANLVNPKNSKILLTDPGLETINLKPKDRFIRYKSSLYSGVHVGAIFYGIYRVNYLKKVLPMKKVIANDQLILAELSLLGEFLTVKKPLLTKRWGGASKSHSANAKAQGIQNNLLVNYPYLVRELLFQAIIWQTKNVDLFTKSSLSVWSIRHFLNKHVSNFFKVNTDIYRG